MITHPRGDTISVEEIEREVFCSRDIHRQLSDIARSGGATISVITVEYDIREDQPEGTDVFSLDTSSPELIEKLIEKRFPNLSQIDRRTIAESSGGNARVALALAGTVGKNETVAGLSDVELFRRLFHQRHDPDASLLLIAQACSLVYSFEGEKSRSRILSLCIQRAMRCFCCNTRTPGEGAPGRSTSR